MSRAEIVPTELPGVVVIESPVYRDDRGGFVETWRADWDAPPELPERFVQVNCSMSRRGVLRGLHFQHPKGQGKLLHVPHGRIFDVVVDVRVGSPTYRRWIGVELDDREHRRLWVPAGLAHGFLVLSDEAVVSYSCTERHAPDCERVLRWDDPAVGVEWPLDGAEPVLSPRDQAGNDFAELEEHLPRWDGE
ncbi:MAG: dTDP-4-dehydrorhamnose 3,5-epimerase [Acidobacteriota bacterium]